MLTFAFPSLILLIESFVQIFQGRDMSFAHLHCHSYFSLLSGASSIEELASAAKARGMEGLALTDTNSLLGAVKFQKIARCLGLKPILGVELASPQEGSAVLLAKNRKGYSAICRATTERHLSDQFSIAASPELASQDIFALCSEPDLLEKICQRRGRTGLFAEVRNFGRPFAPQMRRTFGAARRLGLGLVATNDVHFADPDGYRTHKVLSAIRTRSAVKSLPEGSTAPAEAWLKPPGAMAKLFAELPEAISNAEAIAAECNCELELGRLIFPRYEPLCGATAQSRLRAVCLDGLKRRYGGLPLKALDRLNYELSVIDELDYSDYFLVVWDIAMEAKRRGMPTIGRGSAANSIAAYALGITHVDPIKYDLYFERFLNPQRVSPPDVDLDFPWDRRDEMIAYVYEKYGSDRVAMICTSNRFSARSAVRDVARAFGITPSEISAFTSRLPHTSAKLIERSVEAIPESRDVPVGEEPLKSIIKAARAIDDYPRHLGVHTGGVVISPGPLTEIVALQRASKGVVIAQCDMYDAEDLGLVKIDLLGQRSLSVAVETARQVQRGSGRRIDLDMPLEELEKDPATAELMRSGRTIGCFYIESPGMRALMKKLKVDNFPILVAASSVIRPGPSDSGMTRRFIERHLALEPVSYLHPKLEFLAETYGVMIYQEDVMRVAREVGGMSFGEADLMRRAMSFKGSTEAMLALKEKFIAGAMRNGLGREAAAEVWRQVESFAGYAFCKAHSASYAQLSYLVTYMKAHYPAEFVAAVLSNQGGFYSTFEYIEEARRLGLRILPPDVNQSEVHYTGGGGWLRVGLMQVKGLKGRTAASILAERGNGEYSSLADLCLRAGLSYREAQSLANCGAMDCFGRTRPELMWQIEMAFKKGGKTGRASPGCAAQLPRIGDCTPEEKLRCEEQTLGFTVSAPPLFLYRDALDEGAIVKARDLALHAGKRVKVAGALVTAKRTKLKKRDEYMKFLTLEDDTGIFEVTLFPRAYREYGHLVVGRGPYIVEGKVEDDHGSLSITASGVSLLEKGPKSASGCPGPARFNFVD